MDKTLKSYLEKHKIEYKIYNHKAVFTVAESRNIKKKIPGRHTKCLFLKDNKNQFYLIALPAEKRLNIKLLRNKLQIKDIRFANQEELKQQLNLTPGSVSIFGLIYQSSNSIFLIIDKELWQADEVGFHPNINTSTIILTHENLEKFLNTLNIRKEIMEL